MVPMCRLKCVSPYGVHVSPKMCWAPMHPLKKSISKSITKWCKINENLRGWVPLEPCWLKMTPPWSHLGARWPRGSIFHWFLEPFWDTKMIEKSMKKWSDFQTPKNCVFCAGRSQRLKNGVPKGIQNQAFSGIEQNYRIVLPPARGASFQGLKGSQSTFFPGSFS